MVIDVTGASAARPAEAGETQAPEAGEPQAASKGSPKAEVKDTVAYAFKGAEGPVLYGALAYENTGSAPLTLTKATFAFALEGATEEVEFTPIFADQTVILPGETGYAALWYPLADIEPGADVRLSASLQWQAAEARIPIEVQNLRLAHNYPGFTTMAGVLIAEADCSCNLIYTAFYDANENLLGVWYFTENAHLVSAEPKAFTSHLKEFPLADLAERTAQIRAFGVGME
ncbi:MAG: hypothetical protein VB051_10880 [Candidatus Pelethousia sp.]|nr:hypothetical protein [Candidatus Pelethousia sp.]